VKNEKIYCCQRVLYDVKRNIAANEAYFWDYCSNVGRFLCGVARAKRYVNVYLHLYVSSAAWNGQPKCRLCLPWKNIYGCPCLCYLCLQSNICFVLRYVTIFVLFEYPLFLSVSVSFECAIHHERGMLEDLQPYIRRAKKRRLKPIYMQRLSVFRN